MRVEQRGQRYLGGWMWLFWGLFVSRWFCLVVWGLVGDGIGVERTRLCRGLRGGGFRRTFLLYILL